MKFAVPKGVFDLLPTTSSCSSKDLWRSTHIWHYLEKKIHTVAQRYGFREIRTPIFEKTELFVRGVGESSDIVTKEMYTFEDRGGRSMTLRPEGTAPTTRAFVEKQLNQGVGGKKLYYIGPMFRYERPQAGRFRQHHQFGVEAIGDGSPEQDAEVIDLLCTLYSDLGLTNLTVMLNSVGDAEGRHLYKKALRRYLSPQIENLSEQSQLRFEKNILRILDSKDPNDQKILEKAPSILEFLKPESEKHFNEVKKLLESIGIGYQINPQLVRGLDYYTSTVFEVTSDVLGAQNAIGGGGRYDGLIANLGGPDLPAVGFAVGLERVIQTLIAQKAPFPPLPHSDLILIPLGNRAQKVSFELLHQMRQKGHAVEAIWQTKKVGKALQQAGTTGAKYAAIIGEDELKSGSCNVKDLKSRKEKTIPLIHLAEFLVGK